MDVLLPEGEIYQRSNSPYQTATQLRHGPLASGYRPYTVLDSNGNLLQQEFSNCIEEVQNNLREEFRRQQETSQAKIIASMRETIRQDLEEHRRSEREKLRQLLRVAPPVNQRTVPVDVHHSDAATGPQAAILIIPGCSASRCTEFRN